MRLRLLPLACIATIFMAACSNELPVNSDKDIQAGANTSERTDASVAEFTGAIASADAGEAITRSAATYNGKLDFFYTSGDRLWVNNPNATPALRMDTANNIAQQLQRGRTNKVARASFYFKGDYVKNRKYTVRYTGNGNPVANRVDIKAVQNQNKANDAMELGLNGDCAVGVATYTGSNFDFNLTRSASYITFAPYNKQGLVEGMKLKSVKISNPRVAMSGKFAFNDNGIDLNTRPAADASNKSITLNVNRFDVPNAVAPTKNASIMVVAPGTYDNVTIEYTLYDPMTKVQKTVTKTLPRVSFVAGRNYLVTHDMGVTVYGDQYYMWDAKLEFWHGFKHSQPKQNYAENANVPRKYNDQRYFNPVYFNGGTPVYASASAKNCPNVNLAHWFVEMGEASWDDTAVWGVMGHLYKGGMWVKTEAAIQAKRGNLYPHDLSKETRNGYDFTVTPLGGEFSRDVTRKGKPANTADYFFLPAMGFYNAKGRLQKLGVEGYYWTSSPAPGGYHSAYALRVDANKITLYTSPRDNGFNLWSK